MTIAWTSFGFIVGVFLAGCYWTIWTNRFPWEKWPPTEAERLKAIRLYSDHAISCTYRSGGWVALEVCNCGLK